MRVERQPLTSATIVSWVPLLFLAIGLFAAEPGAPQPAAAAGTLVPNESPQVKLWWALSSARKILPGQTPPADAGSGIVISCARNERDAAQLVLRSTQELKNFAIDCGGLTGPNSSALSKGAIEFLQVEYVNIAQPSDRSSIKGLCPDPLLPIKGPLVLKPDFNHAFWIRLHVGSEVQPGEYGGSLQIQADGFSTRVPLTVKVYAFALPDRLTCTTAFGFSPGNVYRYHGLKTETDKRLVLDKYWASFAAHHVSPYDPAPLDDIRVTWPEIRPPATTWDNWKGLRVVSNEVHAGRSALLINDEKTDENVTVIYEPLIPIPASGIRLQAWYRTAVPGHRVMLSLNHYDAEKKWMPGCNRDQVLNGTGVWQRVDENITDFPAGAQYLRLHLRATTWTDAGERIGLVWFDDLSIRENGTGKELVFGGDFEVKPRTEPVVPLEQLKVRFDFSAWDRAMTKAVDQNHFNSFRIDIPGIGGGTFHEIFPPRLLGLGGDTPEYPVLFDSYCRQLEAHLKSKGWLDEAYVYWFDEPSPDQYPFVMKGFTKLKESCPGIARMLTEQVEPGLLGGPNIWCSITDSYNHERAEERRKHGEKFWWYVCTGPKAPYAGLFTDHPGPEMRVWLWQTFQRNIEGVLVWETTYWNSTSAYPDTASPQNPYTDPMSWMSGYSTPAGDRRPWGNGDGRFIYPPLPAADGKPSAPILDGPVDSIRWEHLRDGLEDYEYLCILRERLSQRRNSLAPGDVKRYEALLRVPESITKSLTEFTADGASIEARRGEIAQAIEELR